MEQNRQKIDRVSAWILAAIGVFVLIGGGLQLRAHLFSFERSLIKQSEEEQIAAAANTIEGSEDGQDLASLQSADSDQDGLTDFEELYVRGTSPYLQDTDSDGVTDFDEIAKGTNPNCPEGDDCLQERVGGEEIVSDAQRALDGLSSGNSSTSTSIETGTATPEEIRAFLLNNGVSQEQINEISDDQLVEVYQQVIEDQQAGATSSGNIEQQINELRSMNTEQRKAYLLQSGVSQTDLDEMTDDELNQAFDAAIDSTVQQLQVQQGGSTANTNSDSNTSESEEDNE